MASVNAGSSPLISACHAAGCRYLELGWSALPFCSSDHLGCGRNHGKRCQSPGKTPLLGEWDQWKVYQSQRIPDWLLDHEFKNHPNANVGIVLGEISGLVGIDVDGPGGRDLLLELADKNVPKTLCFQTANGFRLLYALAAGEEPPRSCKLAASGPRPGRLEVLGNGHCSVMPPSRHRSGKSYAWVVGFSPEERDAAPVPSWLQNMLSPASGSLPNVFNSEGPIREFRNVRLFRAACSLRRQGADGKSILECLTILNRRCEPPLEQAELRQIARNSTRYSPVPYGA